MKDKAKRLLDILPRRGPKAFTNFVESLREDYDWLVDDLEEALVAKENGEDGTDGGGDPDIIVSAGVSK